MIVTLSTLPSVVFCVVSSSDDGREPYLDSHLLHQQHMKNRRSQQTKHRYVSFMGFRFPDK